MNKKVKNKNKIKKNLQDQEKDFEKIYDKWEKSQIDTLDTWKINWLNAKSKAIKQF